MCQAEGPKGASAGDVASSPQLGAPDHQTSPTSLTPLSQPGVRQRQLCRLSSPQVGEGKDTKGKRSRASPLRKRAQGLCDLQGKPVVGFPRCCYIFGPVAPPRLLPSAEPPAPAEPFRMRLQQQNIFASQLLGIACY